MTIVISVENISKSYRLGQISSGTFSNDLKLWWTKALVSALMTKYRASCASWCSLGRNC